LGGVFLLVYTWERKGYARPMDNTKKRRIGNLFCKAPVRSSIALRSARIVPEQGVQARKEKGAEKERIQLQGVVCSGNPDASKKSISQTGRAGRGEAMNSLKRTAFPSKKKPNFGRGKTGGAGEKKINEGAQEKLCPLDSVTHNTLPSGEKRKVQGRGIILLEGEGKKSTNKSDRSGAKEHIFSDLGEDGYKYPENREGPEL